MNYLGTAITIGLFILILGLLVFVHELGHFLLAKRSKVRVIEFAFGFRPRLFGRKIGDTLYAINLIPLGGYVKMFGESTAETGRGSYQNISRLNKFKILIAGSTMNLLLGWIIFTVLIINGFNPLIPGMAENPFINQVQQITIQGVAPNSPADIAGLKVNDTIVSLNNKPIATDIEFITLIQSLRGETAWLEIKRANQRIRQAVEIRKQAPEGEGLLGVTISGEGEVKGTAILAPIAAIYETGRLIGLSFSGLGKFARGLVVDKKVSEEVTGIVGVGALTGFARELGAQYVWQLIGVVSIGLGVVNLLPILPLDGGHIFALAIETVRRKPISEASYGYLTMVGLALLLLIFVIVTYKDLIRFTPLGALSP